MVESVGDMEMKAGWEQRTIRNDGEVSALLKEAPTFCRPCKQFSSQHNCDCVFVNLLRLCFCDCALISNWSFCQLSEDLVVLFTVVALDLHWLNIFSMFSSKHYLDKVESLCLNARLPLPLKVAKTFDIEVGLHWWISVKQWSSYCHLWPLAIGQLWRGIEL